MPTSAGLRILRTNPYSPYEVGFCAIPGAGGGIHVAENYAYVANGSSGLSVVDIRNPTSPNELGSYNAQGLIYDVYVSRNYAYLIALEDGMIILDVSNPGFPTP